MDSVKHRRDRTELLLREPNLYKAFLILALPVFGANFIKAFNELVDTYFIGQIANSVAAQAGVSLSWPLLNIFASFQAGFGVAGVAVISQLLGAGRKDQARENAGVLLAVAVLFGAVMNLLLYFAAPGVMALMGAEGDVFVCAVSYLRVRSFELIFTFIFAAFQAVRQAQGDTLRPMLLNLVGISLNLVLDPLLMITWGMSSAGAALATVLSKAVPAGIAFCLLRRPGQDIRLQAASMRPERDKLMAILRIGLPTALGGSTMQLGFLLMSRSVYVYGVNAMAAYGIGNKVNGLISLPSNAIGSAVGTIVGQNMGAKQPERAAKGYRLAMYCAIGFLFVGGQLLALRPVSQAIVSIFASDADVIAMAADFLSLMAAWCWTNGIYNATSGLFQGAGHTEVTMAVDASRLWVFRFATLYFCQNLLHMGVESVWYSVVISNGISSAILLGLYFSGLWRKSRFKTDA